MPLPELVDEQEEWVVEDILDHQGEGDKVKYLVKWEDWPAEYNTWEPPENLANAQRLLQSYWRRAKRRHHKWDD